MVAVNRIINITTLKNQPKVTQNFIKKTAPIAGLSVLAGSGMSDTSDIKGHLPDGADVFNDPILDQLSYRASQISDAAAAYLEIASGIVDDTAQAAAAAGGAVVDGFVHLDDCATAAYTKVIETVSDILG